MGKLGKVGKMRKNEKDGRNRRDGNYQNIILVNKLDTKPHNIL